MYGIIFKIFALGISIVAILYLIGSTFKRARHLDARIQAFKDEQEEAKKQGRILDPYAELANLYTEQPPSARPR